MIEYKALLGTSSLSAYTLAATMALGATTMSVTIPQQSTDNKYSSIITYWKIMARQYQPLLISIKIDSLMKIKIFMRMYRNFMRI